MDTGVKWFIFKFQFHPYLLCAMLSFLSAVCLSTLIHKNKQKQKPRKRKKKSVSTVEGGYKHELSPSMYNNEHTSLPRLACAFKQNWLLWIKMCGYWPCPSGWGEEHKNQVTLSEGKGGETSSPSGAAKVEEVCREYILTYSEHFNLCPRSEEGSQGRNDERLISHEAVQVGLASGPASLWGTERSF